MVITSIAYGVPYMLDRAGYALEAGRSRAASEALAKLDESGLIKKSSALFRMATQVITPAVVNIRSFSLTRTSTEELGSGVVIDRQNGYIVTNEHVVHNAEQIVVRIGKASAVEATLVGVDERTDLAVLKIKGPLGVQGEWGDSTKMEVGDWVLAVGSPFALDRTVTAGIISATGRHNLPGVSMDTYEDYLQTDAAINPGNSGGPLIDLEGRVIGINTAIINPTIQGQGIGLVIPSEIAKKVVQQIVENGKVVRAYIGVIPDPLPPAIAKDSGLPDGQEGVFVSGIRPQSPAFKAGLKPGDIIIDVDGKPVTDPKSLRTRTFILPIGSQVAIGYYRDGKKSSVTLTTEAMPELLANQKPSLGLELAEVPEDQGGGVVVTKVDPGSPAQFAGLKPGMKILMLARTPIRNRKDFETTIVRFDPLQGIPVGVLVPGRGVEFLNLTTLGVPRR
jgi:serine protease Do